jgi:hypothetical protein
MDLIKRKPYLIIIGILVLILSVNGILGFWNQFKTYIVNSELEKQGLVLRKEEIQLVEEKNVIETEIKEQSKVVEEVNYQSYKKNKNETIKKKFKEKGVILTDNDIKYLSDSGLVTKYLNKK